MITQGMNRPLAIGLAESIEGYVEIHVSLHNAIRELKHWRESDIEVLDNKALICPITQAESVEFAAGRAYVCVKWLDNDGIVHQTVDMPISIRKFADKHVMGDDSPITEFDIQYDGELEDAQGVLNPDSVRTAIVIRADGVEYDDTEIRGELGTLKADIESHEDRIEALEDAPSGGGYVASDTAPDDHSVLWIDTDDTSGGGGGSGGDGYRAMRIINETEFTDTTNTIWIDTDMDGKPFELDEVFIKIYHPAADASEDVPTYAYIKLNAKTTETYTGWYMFPSKTNYRHALFHAFSYGLQIYGHRDNTSKFNSLTECYDEKMRGEKIRQMEIWAGVGKATFVAGSRIIVWGR